MEHVPSAHGRSTASGLGVDVVDFLDLERGHLAVFVQPGGDARNLTPPFRSVGFHFELGGLDDLLLGALLLAIGIWWIAGAKRRYTGPIRTIEWDEAAGVIEDEPAEPPEPTWPAPAAA